MVVFYFPVTCPSCGHEHKRYVNQTMPLYMDFWHIINLHRCPPNRGGCGQNIVTMVRPVDAYIEQQLPNSPVIDVKQFVSEVEHCYIRGRDGLARFNVKGTIVAIKFDVQIRKYDGTREEWFTKDKRLTEREVKRYGH